MKHIALLLALALVSLPAGAGILFGPISAEDWESLRPVDAATAVYLIFYEDVDGGRSGVDQVMRLTTPLYKRFPISI